MMPPYRPQFAVITPMFAVIAPIFVVITPILPPLLNAV